MAEFHPFLRVAATISPAIFIHRVVTSKGGVNTFEIGRRQSLVESQFPRDRIDLDLTALGVPDT